METDEEDNSGCALQFQNDSAVPPVTPVTTAEELPFAEPQCRLLPEAEMSVAQLSAGDGESQFIPPETDTELPDTREYRDVVAGDNSCGVDISEFQVGGSGEESQLPRSLIPQVSVDEGDQDKGAQAEEEEARGTEPVEIPQEIPGKSEKDGDLMPREGGHETREDGVSALNKKDNNEDGEGDMNAGIEFTEVNEGIETKMEVNSVMGTEEVVTGIMDEPAMTCEDKESIEKTSVEEEPKEDATDVVEGTAEDSVKEENENEAEVEEKKVETREESMLVDEEVVLPTGANEIEEETEAAEEDAFNETEQMDEMKTEDGMEKEDRDVADAVTDMEETEAADETEEGDDAEEVEGGDNAEEIEEEEEEEDDDDVEEIEEEDEDDAEEMEEGDNAEEIEMADGTEEAADEVEEVSKSSGGKRKRGKNGKAPARTSSRKTMEEDVCFICFDGGELVLCDRRGCPKAYHPTCVNRDDAFFRARGRWNCGFPYMTAILSAADLCV